MPILIHKNTVCTILISLSLKNISPFLALIRVTSSETKSDQTQFVEGKADKWVKIRYQCGEDEVVVFCHHPHRHGLGKCREKEVKRLPVKLGPKEEAPKAWSERTTLLMDKQLLEAEIIPFARRTSARFIGSTMRWGGWSTGLPCTIQLFKK